MPIFGLRLLTAPTRLAVLGSPIAHSRSPQLHAAAYRALGLDWNYTAEEVTSAMLPGFLSSRDPSWRGLSLTMPLKRDVVPLLTHRHRLVTLTGSANTVLLDRESVRGFNTDVFGLTEGLRRNGIGSVGRVLIIGAGATAASAVVAAAELGADRVGILARTPAAAKPLAELAAALGAQPRVQALEDGRLDAGVLEQVDAVISTVPNGTALALAPTASPGEQVVLFDVAYDPWPTALAASWMARGGRAISGLEMLANQALLQVRVFVNGDPDAALPAEHDVATVMRSAVGLTG